MSSFSKSSIVKVDFNPDVKEGFPLAVDDTTLAFHLGIRGKTLWYLLHKRNAKKAYKCFSIPQYNKDGTFKKKREIQEPMPHLKNVHTVLNNMFSEIEVDDYTSAYVRGRNCADAARKHVRKSFTFDEEKDGLDPFEDSVKKDPRYSMIKKVRSSHDPNSGRVRYYHQPITMIKIDIKDFFPSIKASWIREYFCKEVGYNFYVSSLLASLCSVSRTVRNKQGEHIEVRHLPQGSPLSGSLANLVGSYRFGRKIKDFLNQHSSEWVFTIYSDDIILTHPSNTLAEGEPEKVRDAVINIVTESGFRINTKKTQIKYSYRDRIKILGCVVTDQLNVPRTVRKRIASTIFNCKMQGFESQCRDGQTVQGLLAQLRGLIEYIRSIRPELAAKIGKNLDEALEAQGMSAEPTILEGSIF